MWEKVDRNFYPLIAFGYKSNVLSSPNASSDKLRDIKFSTYIDINSKTAKEFGIKYPSRPTGHVLFCYVSGATARNTIPVKITKIKSLMA